MISWVHDGVWRRARTASGQEFLAPAKERLGKANTISPLRQAQAVVFPLEWGLSMAQTAAMLGIPEGWACHLRRRFIGRGGCCDEAGLGRGGRCRETLAREAEAAFLTPFLERAAVGGLLVVGESKMIQDYPYAYAAVSVLDGHLDGGCFRAIDWVAAQRKPSARPVHPADCRLTVAAKPDGMPPEAGQHPVSGHPPATHSPGVHP